jgi:hypothetical protein
MRSKEKDLRVEWVVLSGEEYDPVKLFMSGQGLFVFQISTMVATKFFISDFMKYNIVAKFNTENFACENF